MSDQDYISGPHTDDLAAVRAVGKAGECAIVRLHHVDDQVFAHVWIYDTVALYLGGARACLQVFAERMPVPPRGTTGYAMVIPTASVARLIDPVGTTSTMALGPEFKDDPVSRDEVYEGLRAVFTADRVSRLPSPAKAFPRLRPDQPPNASTALTLPTAAPPAPPAHRRTSH